MKNGNMPAMPLRTSNGALWNLRDGHEDSNYLGQPHEKFSIGMTKREQFAAMAMQGLLSKHGYDDYPEHQLAAYAVAYADTLLAELERTK